MYRALIGMGGPIFSNGKVFQRLLVNQFLNSSIASSVSVYPPEADKIFLEDFAENPKLMNLESSSLELIETKQALFLTSADLISPDTQSGLDHVAFISSIFQKFPSAKEEEFLRQVRARSPKARVTAFRLGRIVSAETGSRSLTNIDLIMDKAYELGSQFMPAKYREISAGDLAQAMRLNYETCAPEYLKQGEFVETVDFVDCMKILGLEDRI